MLRFGGVISRNELASVGFTKPLVTNPKLFSVAVH